MTSNKILSNDLSDEVSRIELEIEEIKRRRKRKFISIVLLIILVLTLIYFFSNLTSAKGSIEEGIYECEHQDFEFKLIDGEMKVLTYGGSPRYYKYIDNRHLIFYKNEFGKLIETDIKVQKTNSGIRMNFYPDIVQKYELCKRK